MDNGFIIDAGMVGARQVVRKDSKYYQLHDSTKVHPELSAIFADLEAQRTGNIVDWAWLEKNLVSIKGDIFRYSSVLRTPQEQADLYASGRTEKGDIVTKSNAYRSFHNWGLAVDFVLTKYGYGVANIDGVQYDFSKPAAWLKTGIPQFLESRGLTWGGRWPWDVAHFELRKWVPKDNAFWGSPWWALSPELVSIGSRSTGLDGQAWVVIAALMGGYFLLKERS